MIKKTHVLRNQKDTVFRMLYRDKKELLQLYNALNGSSHELPENLEVCTLENAGSGAGIKGTDVEYRASSDRMYQGRDFARIPYSPESGGHIHVYL